MAFEHILAFSTPLGVAFTDVFACCLKEVLNEYSYYADCAGLQYDVRVTKGGFELMFYGYHHKLPVLVQKVYYVLRVSTIPCCLLAINCGLFCVFSVRPLLIVCRCTSHLTITTQIIVIIGVGRNEEYGHYVGCITPISNSLTTMR